MKTRYIGLCILIINKDTILVELQIGSLRICHIGHFLGPKQNYLTENALDQKELRNRTVVRKS